MEADCPPRIDRVNSYLLDERTSFFYMLVYNSNGKCLLRSGQVSCPPEQADTNQSHELRAGNIEPYWSALGTAGRGYGGASYPAPISLAAVVVPTAGRAAKPPVPLIRSTLFPA